MLAKTRAHMRTRRIMVYGGSAIVLAVLLCLALSTYWERSQPVFDSAPKLTSAVQAFARDLTARKAQLPRTVSLRALLDGGYIAASDVRAFEGMEVQISLAADETQPQQILISARLPDGSVTALMGDGSVQQFSPQRYDKYRRQMGQPNGPANRSQPVQLGTNSTSLPAGSGR
jgi:hypothetical protein